MSEFSNLPDTATSTITTNATASLIKEMKRAREAHATQIQQLTALVATATTNNALDPATGGAGARIHYNPVGTYRVRYPPSPPIG